MKRETVTEKRLRLARLEWDTLAIQGNASLAEIEAAKLKVETLTKEAARTANKAARTAARKAARERSMRDLGMVRTKYGWVSA